MDVTHILDGLNDRQREVVTAPRQSLVVAGAGSGKTRVLVHHIAWLIEAEGVSPHGVLAVTFTNKAAAQMRARIEQLLGISVRNLWVGTFHGIAHRLLRTHWQDDAHGGADKLQRYGCRQRLGWRLPVDSAGRYCREHRTHVVVR